jgi:hypothetical protein
MSSRRLASLIAAVSLLGLAAAPAMASPRTIKRSFENLTQWPLDVALSPVIAGRDIYVNMREIEDSTAVRIFYPLPGWAWNTMVQCGAGVLRGVTGVIEVIPGLLLLPFPDADLEPLFDPADENEGLVQWENGIYDVKFGISYTGSSS